MAQPMFSANGGDEHAILYRPSHRSISHAHYIDRYSPYNYHDQALRVAAGQEYHTHRPSQTMIHEPDDDVQEERRTRKRISVACLRCRKRKIKCSGPVGGAQGACTACIQAGIDRECTFARVGTIEDGEIRQHMRGSTASSSVEIVPLTHVIVPPMGTYSEAPVSTPDDLPMTSAESSTYHAHHPPLPALHTRGGLSNDYSVSYDNGIFENGYSYPVSTTPRYDSFSNESNLYNCRSGSMSTAFSAPHTTGVNIDAYSFGSLQASSMAQPSFSHLRLPSVTQDPFSALDLGLLNASLPAQTVQTRRLPALPVLYQQQFPNYHTGMPQPRALGSFMEPRIPISSIHHRNSMTWPSDNESGITRNGSLAYYPTSKRSAMSSAAPDNNTESGAGYHINNAGPSTTGSNTPNGSPSSIGTPTETLSPTPTTSTITTTSSYPNVSTTWSSSSSYPIRSVPVSTADSSPPRFDPFLNYAPETAVRSWKATSLDSDDRYEHTNRGGSAYDPQAHHRQHQQYRVEHARETMEPHRRRPSPASSDERRISTAQRMSISNLR